MSLKLSLACVEYDHTRALLDGKVRPEGIDLTVKTFLKPGEIFWRMLQYGEFDISEMSLSNYLTEKCQENQRFIAIPVFPARVFRHGYIFINKNSGISDPEDLRHKKVGVPEYSMTALVWIRGLLQHDYGVAPSDIEWYVGGQEGVRHKDRIAIKLPENIRLHDVPEEKSLDDMLLSGEIDALLMARIPNCVLSKHPDVARLWADYRKVETEYYTRTKIFPIMHTVVIKREIYEEHPWVAQSMFKAFSEAKRICRNRLSKSSFLAYTLPWTRAEYQYTVDLMGDDFWAYGLAANRITLDAMTQYSFEQGLSNRKFSPEELFAANTLEQKDYQ